MALSFREEWVREIPYLGLRMVKFRHACGLEVVSVECSDVENVFIAGFQTESCDDRGIQHVVEHSVMGGSRHYRVKGPCDELSRGSLATYINAETYQDRTLYPYASLNASDFRHGVDVYLDAVFNPLLRKETFMQEGWRYAFQEDGEGHRQLRTTGIVLNERRAQLNDMSDVALGAAYRELLPGHPLSYDSGGLPGVIETLDYESFVEFYRSHYHPRQARLYFYGDLSTAEKLRWVGDYLACSCSELLGQSSPCPRYSHEIVPWTSPRVVERILGIDSTGEGDCGWTLNWHLGRLLGRGERLGLELLYMLMLEDDSSPLRHALMDSGLCEDLMDCTGLETEHGECLFIVGAVNCDHDDFDELRHICLDCLERLARTGFREAQVWASFNQLCLRYREVPNGYGLQVGRTVMRNWLSDLDPLLGLDYRRDLDELQEILKEDRGFLVSLLRRYLVDNVHRVEIHLRPDATAMAQAQAAEAARLEAVHASLDSASLSALEGELASWQRYQAEGDSREALESFPRLRRSELPRTPFDPVCEREVLPQGEVLLRGAIPSDGINYVKLGYDLSVFDEEELRFLPVFVCLLDSVGVEGKRYGQFEHLLGLAGCEMDLDVQLEGMGVNSARGMLTMKLSGLSEHWPAALDCLEERRSHSVFTEKGRMREVLRQCWSQAGQKLYTDDEATDFVVSRSASGVSLRDILYEEWYGVEGVCRLGEAIGRLRGSAENLTSLMERMMRRLASSTPQIVSYVGDDVGFAQVRNRLLADCRASVPLSFLPVLSGGQPWSGLGRREWLPVTCHESCCSRSFRTCTYDDPLWAGLCVYSELLSEGYLMDEIRMGGGAYGGGCSYYPGCGLFQMYSYSDPNPRESFRVFDRATGYVSAWSEGQITGAIVGCVRGDVPLHASECCNAMLSRELIGLSNEARQARRDCLLRVSLRDVRQAAEALREFSREGWNDCVAGDGGCCPSQVFASVGWGRPGRLSR